MKHKELILDLTDVGIHDIQIVGGKNASLGEMLNNLSAMGIQIPKGFVVTVEAYRQFIDYNDLSNYIANMLEQLDNDNLSSLQECGEAIRNKIMEAKYPDELKNQIENAYLVLSTSYKTNDVDVAVRSSATAEDLPDASFAGQQETYLNVRGVYNILVSIKKCFASLFTNRAISYRKSFGYDHQDIGLSVCIQKMVRSDVGASGVAFSLDTESGFKDVVLINGTFGLGELVVQGVISPDEFLVFKPTLKQGFDALLEKKLGKKDKKMVYGNERVKVKTIPTNKDESTTFCLSDVQALQLAKWVVYIEEYYTKIKGYWCPMDVEWALDGESKELYIVQARPETIHSRKDRHKIINYHIKKGQNQEILLEGIAVGDKIGAGKVKVVDGNTNELGKIGFCKGDVLVTEMTDPDWEPLMKMASAIVTERGGRTCHAAIVARELGIPAIVAASNARQILQDDDEITVCCAEGDTGLVYKGILDMEETEININSLPTPNVPIMLNVASPDVAFQYTILPHAGIGLARLEFIINNYIKIHPLALLNNNEIRDKQVKTYIEDAIKPYHNGEDFFVSKLSQGIAKIAASGYPRQVIVRFSDFKSNEYANLIGGHDYEPTEENPMIGWRGASRYYSEEYKKAFALECRAIKKVRDEMGLNNVVVMIPFCRTVAELHKVYAIMEENGLYKGKNDLKIYLMAELPSNFMLAEEFAEHIDGFSIGSNDLTQLVLGLDRDSAKVAHLYDERNMAIKRMIKVLLQSVKGKPVKIGICGQGPSDFPDFSKFLIEEGIHTISVTPDSFYKTLAITGNIRQPQL
ncbi:MAG TPA: phosphoenolpyruvate synthase [Sphingobacterium sp.]|nr:phosphoenolpyruvate synthase [Sphingobacterium sp.]